MLLFVTDAICCIFLSPLCHTVCPIKAETVQVRITALAAYSQEKKPDNPLEIGLEYKLLTSPNGQSIAQWRCVRLCGSTAG